MEGDIAIEQTQFECFHVNRTTNEIEQHQATVHASLIPFDEIHTRTLQHIKYGYYICTVNTESLSNEILKSFLCGIGQLNEQMTQTKYRC